MIATTKLCHAHHVTPLALQFEHGFLIPDQRFEWLCPNHHGLVHLAIDALLVNGEFEFFADIEPAEVDAVMALARLGITRLKESGSLDAD